MFADHHIIRCFVEFLPEYPISNRFSFEFNKSLVLFTVYFHLPLFVCPLYPFRLTNSTQKTEKSAKFLLLSISLQIKRQRNKTQCWLLNVTGYRLNKTNTVLPSKNTPKRDQWSMPSSQPLTATITNGSVNWGVDAGVGTRLRSPAHHPTWTSCPWCHRATNTGPAIGSSAVQTSGLASSIVRKTNKRRKKE